MLHFFCRHGGLPRISCITCAIQEGIAHVSKDIIDEEEAVDAKLEDMGMRREKVPGDSWCLIYSWYGALQQKGYPFLGGPLGLAEAACQELLTNAKKYFLYGDFKMAIKNFLENKCFNNDTLDPLGFALSEVTNTKCRIVSAISTHDYMYGQEGRVYDPRPPS